MSACTAGPRVPCCVLRVVMASWRARAACCRNTQRDRCIEGITCKPAYTPYLPRDAGVAPQQPRCLWAPSATYTSVSGLSAWLSACSKQPLPHGSIAFLQRYPTAVLRPGRTLLTPCLWPCSVASMAFSGPSLQSHSFTRASLPPLARRELLGCQSTDRTSPPWPLGPAESSRNSVMLNNL